MAFVYKLELEDGTRPNPPTFRSAPGVSWEPGDTIPLGRDRKLRVVAVRDDHADQPPVLVVEQAIEAPTGEA